MVPMRVCRNDDALEVREDGFHRLGPVRRRRREGCPQITGFDVRQNGPLVRRFQIIGDPIDHRVAVFAELRRRHVLHRRDGRPRRVLHRDKYRELHVPRLV